MTSHGKDHQHGHDHHGQEHHEHGHNQKWHWHRDWRLWVGVIAMLMAMVAYVMSGDEALRPGQPAQQEMPAAP
jgi:hypothetical protein